MKEEDKQPPQKDLEGQRRVKSDNFLEIEENLGQDISYDATEQLLDKNDKLSSCNLKIKNQQIEAEYQSYLYRRYVFRAKALSLVMTPYLAYSVLQTFRAEDKE